MLQLIVNRLRALGINVSRYNHPKKMATDSTYAVKCLLKNREVRVVFDLGANVGQTARLYREVFPSALIYSFEPFESTYRQLSESFFDDPKVKPFQLAMSDIDGQQNLFCSADNTCNSLLPPGNLVANEYLREKLKSTNTVVTESCRIDTFCERNGVEHIDLLKLDIQGAELKALEGAKDHLSNGRVSLIFTEV